MIRITLRAKTLAELQTKLKEILASWDKLDGAVAASASAGIPAGTSVKRTRKSKTETNEAPLGIAAEPVVNQAPAATALASDGGEEIPKTKLIEMLQKVSEKGGMPAARDVLSRFGVNRVGEIPKEKYPEFLDECAKAIA